MSAIPAEALVRQRQVTHADKTDRSEQGRMGARNEQRLDFLS
jgi:hypothetical protein